MKSRVERKKDNKKLIKICGAITLLVLIVISGIAAILLNRKKESSSIYGNLENLRAMNYEQFVPGDDAVYEDGTQGTDNEQIVNNIKFSSFFLRDLDGDGYAEKLKGTCKEIGNQDTLYMEIIVQTEGYLKDGKIEIDSKNFYFQTNLPKDNELKNNYMSNNTKEIEMETLNCGTQKMIMGIVRSGDYTYSSQRTLAIGNDINNYSRNDNKIVLTGIYVDEEGIETAIRKEIPMTIDWHGITAAKIYTKNSSYDGEQIFNDIESRIDEENGKITLDFYVYPTETKKALNISNNYLEGTIPMLNGYAPISVTLKSGSGEFNYDEDTRKFTITREALVNEEGIITSSVPSSLSYGIKVEYPLDAYTASDNEEITINVLVNSYFKGFNNPNTEFQNPYISNTATATIIAKYRKHVEQYYSPRVDIKVGKYVYFDSHNYYYISKKKPLRLYNGLSSEENEDYYTVRWYVSTGTNGEYNKLVLKENQNGESTKVDTFIKSDNTEESMEDITSNVGIYFSEAGNLLKENGEIKIYDEDTDNLIVIFTKDGANGSKKWGSYTERNPYYYDVPVKHVRIETSNTNAGSSMTVHNIKELDDEYITESYTREEFDNFKYIKSNLSIYADGNLIGTNTHQAVYEEPYSIANISISKDVITTQVTEENFNINIYAVQNESYNQVGWTNGTFVIKLPDELLTTEINSITTDNANLNIISYEIIENDGHNFIKIKTNNSEPLSYTIAIDANITPDPRISTVNKKFELYAINEETSKYYYRAQDIYDIDHDENTEELVNYRTKSINLVAPNSVLTNQTISEFDDTGTVIIAPQVVDLKPIYSQDDLEKQTVKIGVQMKNNYSSTISETKIVGKIPFEGNSYVVSGRNLNSEFSTVMKPFETLEGSKYGIEVPEELKNKVTVYYSENENPSKDVENTENGWTIAENVEDWTKIKTYLIDLEDTIINVGAEYVFYYTVEIPFGVEFNKIAYSHHGIYFSLDTPEGKYRTSTEPNKIGVRIADKYNLELTKYQTGKEKKVEGATYKVSKLTDGGDVENSQTSITNSEGKLEMANLYAERIYEITEIETPSNYELSGEVVGIVGHVDRTTGVFTIEKLYGDTRDEITVQKNDGEDYKAKVNVEDEARAALKIVKTDKVTNLPIKGVKYKIYGTGLGNNGRTVTTSAPGEVWLNGIRIGEPYSLEETKAEGYYLASLVTFKIINNNGTYEIHVKDEDNNFYKLDEEGKYVVEVDDGTGNTINETKEVDSIKSSIMTENDSLPILNLNLEDSSIPRYNLEITKIKHITEVEATQQGGGGGNGNTGSNEEITYLQGAKFKLYKDGKEKGTYITDENGKLIIENLYQYEEEKGVNQTYVLKEILAPEGYTRVKDITFKVSNTLGVLNYEEVLEDGQSEKNYIVEGNTVKLTVEDNPTFKLIKKDGETGEILPNTKFAIYNVDNGIVSARNSKGELIGQREIINGKEYYVVTTDNNGEITLDLPEGLYKAVEVEASDVKYDLEGQEFYFGIGANNEEYSLNLVPEWGVTVGNEYSDTINHVIEISDGSTVAGGTRIYRNNGGSINQYAGIIIKYNANGEKVWETTVGNEINSIVETTDGELLFGGTSNYYQSPGPSYDHGTLVGKINGDGDINWKSTSDKVDMNFSYYATSAYIYDVAEISNGKYVAVGTFSGPSLKIGDHTLSNHVYQGYSENYYRNEGVIIIYNSEGNIERLEGVGNINSDGLNSIVSTEDGGYLIGGYYTGSISIGEHTLTNSTNATGMLIKYTSEGGVEWVNQIANDIITEVKSIAIAEDGGYIVGGVFKGDLIIGENTFTNNDRQNIVIIKYNANGEVGKATAFGGTLDDAITEIYVADDGKILVSGYFNSGSLVLGKYILSNMFGVSSGFVAKCSEDFEVEWAASIEEDNNNAIKTVIETENGSYIIGGFFNKKIEFYDFSLTSDSNSQDGMLIRFKELEEKTIVRLKRAIGVDVNVTSFETTTDNGYIVGGSFSNNITLGEYELNSRGGSDGVIIKYSRNGEIEWAKSVGGNENESISVVKESLDGGYIVGGYFKSNRASIDDYTLEDADDNTHGYANVMVIKLSYDGEVEWTKSLNGKWEDDVSLLETTSDGGCILGGVFKSDSLSVDNFVISNQETSGNSSKGDAYVVKLSSDGRAEWLSIIGGTSYDGIDAIAETTDEGYLVAGYFHYNVTVNNNTYTNKDSNASYSDTVLVKYNKNGNVEWTRIIGGTRNDRIKSIIKTENGENLLIGFSYSETIELGDDLIINKGSNTGIIIKYDDNGNLLMFDSLEKYPSKMVKVDNGYVVIYSNPSILYKYDNDFNIVWLKKLDSLTLKDVNVVNGDYTVLASIYNSSVTIDGIEIASNGDVLSTKILRINEQKTMIDTQELLVENKLKEFKITTDINEIDGIKGGSISGEDLYKYESVKYNDNSTKEIKITPDDGYEIINITLNGDEWQFEPESDGSYTMPQFENVLEDKKVVVTFSAKDNKITINKIDSKNGNILEGAKFKLDQLEERDEPVNGNILGNITDNGQPYYYINPNNEITGVLGELTNNGDYYFVTQNDGEGNISYVPTNSKTWQIANVENATTGVQNSTAHSYIPINLSGLTGYYKVLVNAECSSQTSDIGFARIRENTTPLPYNFDWDRFIYISGSQSAKDYESTIALEGGKTYYLHLGYYKNASTDTDDDQIKINSVKIYKADEVTYNFVENGNGGYESSNQGKVGTVCNSYIPINLENYEGKYNVNINAALQNSNYYDSAYGYVTITENTNRPLYNSSTGRIIYLTSSTNAKDYSTLLEGGKTYYMHFGYYLSSTRNISGPNKLIINSIDITLSDVDLYHTTAQTNSEGKAITQIPFGKYAITETISPEGYILDEIPTVIEFRADGLHEFTIENDKKCNVIVHHYYKENGIPTTTKVAEDDIIQGKEGDTYSTAPKIDLLNYGPEKNDNEEIIMPEQYTGEFTYEDKEVIYYYTQKGTLLTVHHYIEGTETEVPLKDGSLSEPEYIVGNKGARYETTSLTEDELSDYYVYSHVDGDASGIYGNNEIIVTYYYKKAQSGLTVNKYDEDGVTPLEGAEFIISDVNDNIVQLGEMTNNGNYFFEKQDGKYISNNQNRGSTVAYSYMKIDMTNAKRDAKVVVNAEISSQSSYDIGFARITENTNSLAYNNSTGRFIYISGTQVAKDYEANLEKGKVYYLHLGYRKNANTNTGTDTFTINRITIKGAKVPQVYTTNSTGKIEEEFETGEYEIREIKAPYGYITSSDVKTVGIRKQNGTAIDIINERKTGRVIVHHYVEGTEIPVAEDDIIRKKVFERYDTSIAESALSKYTLVTNPPNKTGTVREEDTVVIYYYRRITGNLKINKVDKDTGEPIEGIDFGIYEGNYGKVALDDAIKVGNIYNKVTADKTDESDINPELSVPNGWTGFETVNEKYIPVNSTWYVNNEDSSHQGDSRANAYVNIDLRDKSEDTYFVLTANVEMRNTMISDGVYVWFRDGYINGNWISLTGENNRYYEVALKGGRNYQLEMQYSKLSGSDVEDYVVVEMKLYNAENGRVDTVNEVPYYIVGEATDEEIQIEKEHYTDTNNGLPFVENNGKYIASTCQKYMNDNGIDPSNNVTTRSEELIVIDITDKEGFYDVSMDLLMHNTTDDDWFYSWIVNANNYDEGKYLETVDGKNADGLAGEHNEKYHAILEGGKKYYLYLDYGKNSSSDIEDYVEVSNIKLFKANAEKKFIGFDKTDDGKYVSNNQGQNGTTAHSVIPIDLRDKEETVELTINAEISSEAWNDQGYLYVTDVFNPNDSEHYRCELINSNGDNSGEVAARDYTLELEGGRLYYLNMVFVKNWADNNDVGDDTFTINSIKAETPLYDTITTNSEGIVEIALPTNNYTLVEFNPKDGYEPLDPQKITLTREGLEVTIENERIKGKVIVNHFIEGTEENITDYDGEEIKPELKKGDFGETFETEPRDDLSDKYEIVEIPSQTDGTYTENPQTITYYYRIKKYPYVVNYLLKDDDNDDSNNTILHEQKSDGIDYDYGTIINTDDEKEEIEGYKVDSSTADNLKITNQNNILNIYYIVDEDQTREIKYFVEFYKSEEISDTIEEKTDVQVLEPRVLEVKKDDINLVDKYTGYIFDRLMLNDDEIQELPDTVNENDVIKVYYKKDSFAYTVEYYFDDVKDGDITEDGTAEYGDIIRDYIDKIKTGYRLKEDVLPIQITENEDDNVMKVYYVTDDSQTKELTYKVEYYKDEEEEVRDAHNETITVQVLQPDTITVEKTKINIIDKYEHYTLDKIEIKSGDEITEVTELPDTVNDNDIIKVYYKQMKYPYTIEYYFDDIIDDKLTEDGEASFGEEITDYTDNIKTGYKLKEEVLPLQITDDMAQNIMKVYYIIDDSQTKELTYKVEYYKDDKKIEADTINKKVSVQILQPDTATVDKTEINITDKYEHSIYEKMTLNNEVVTSIPDTVQNGDTIKVYYKVKESQIVVKYVDEDGNTIKDNTIINGKYGETYDLDKVNETVNGYKLKSKSEEGFVTFEESPKEIVFVYKKVETQEKPKENTNTANPSVTIINNETIINVNNQTITNVGETKKSEPVQTIVVQNPTSYVIQTQKSEDGTKEVTYAKTDTSGIDATKVDTSDTKGISATPNTGDNVPELAIRAIALVVILNVAITIYKKTKKEDE